jgi:feruloyl esterase
MILTIGTNDTLASPGAQLDYDEAVINRMGRAKVDEFARFFVLPQTSHGLFGTSYTINGDGEHIQAAAIPNTYDRLPLLMDWVEKRIAPPRQITVSAGERTLPMCSYPEYPKYVSGSPADARSYACAHP